MMIMMLLTDPERHRETPQRVLDPTEELFSSRRWKVYDHHPHGQMSLCTDLQDG